MKLGGTCRFWASVYRSCHFQTVHLRRCVTKETLVCQDQMPARFEDLKQSRRTEDFSLTPGHEEQPWRHTEATWPSGR